ncbi:hypothetical protein QOZ80_7AG0558420 [Eleusine coracana subsp. coracana]|nr:hypothetical protein QOZ80_7AG0558420 [Eleusine coracana subsp. coracana]
MHIDCSKWESRRALQRVVAEQLELPAEVMEMFDKQDEEDDYRGVALRRSIWPIGDLLEVFHRRRRKLSVRRQSNFPKLKRIHLHELPRLHGICDPGLRIYAPELKTVIVRGCWSLKCLPVVNNAVQCFCEKEWWDGLKWEDKSQKELYRPIHSTYHKTTQLRGSVLR